MALLTTPFAPLSVLTWFLGEGQSSTAPVRLLVSPVYPLLRHGEEAHSDNGYSFCTWRTQRLAHSRYSIKARRCHQHRHFDSVPVPPYCLLHLPGWKGTAWGAPLGLWPFPGLGGHGASEDLGSARCSLCSKPQRRWRPPCHHHLLSCRLCSPAQCHPPCAPHCSCSRGRDLAGVPAAAAVGGHSLSF